MLPSRIRGPRSKADRERFGYEPMEIGPAREPKVKRRSPSHCNFVRDHDCCVPGCKRRPIEVAHVRIGGNAGIGQKPSDRWTISLCADCHREQHTIGEKSFEQKHGIDMKALAEEFARKSPKWNILKDMP